MSSVDLLIIGMVLKVGIDVEALARGKWEDPDASTTLLRLLAMGMVVGGAWWTTAVLT